MAVYYQSQLVRVVGIFLHLPKELPIDPRRTAPSFVPGINSPRAEARLLAATPLVCKIINAPYTNSLVVVAENMRFGAFHVLLSLLMTRTRCGKHALDPHRNVIHDGNIP